MVGRAGRWLWLVLAHNYIVIAIASLVWLIWRSGSQPRRMAYPCQQAASANLGALAVLVVPALARRRRGRAGRTLPPAVQLATGSVALAGVLWVLISAESAVYSDPVGTYVPGYPAIVPWTAVDLSEPAQLTPRLFSPTGDEAVVAVNRDPDVIYGTAPYGPGANTAYDLIWQTVADLHLGPSNNPLADFVQDVDGDGTIEVLIKPNTVEYLSANPDGRSPVYSHPATIRPLVDMAALAGAHRILVGDGSDGTGSLFVSRMDPMGYSQSYFNQLGALWPGVSIQRVDFANLGYWRWMDLNDGPGGASAYVGSGYASDILRKAHVNASYFSATDPHGRTGPGQQDCIGWLALTDYLLEPDVIIDLAKLKVHYYGVSTAILKNWVGITMFSTYDMSNQYWARVSHEVDAPTDYERTFGNDILWRELTDAHRAVIYGKDGVIHSTPQRRLLCILDAINCAERYHVPEHPWPYWLHTVAASVDPVAVDAVGARLQRYDFRNIPIINNAHATSIGSPWPVGTGDPGQVRIVGSTMIDDTYDHRFLFDDRYGPGWPDWDATVVDDLTPPEIIAAGAQDVSVEPAPPEYYVSATISNAHVAYYHYGDDGSGAPKVVRLAKDGNEFSATIDDASAGAGVLVAQDTYFNTARYEIVNAPVIKLSTPAISRAVHCGESVDDDIFTVQNIGIDTLDYTLTVTYESGPAVGWLNLDPMEGNSAGEADTVTVSYNTAPDLMPGTYVATIAVSDPAAANDPTNVTVTLEIQTVSCDFAVQDGDVDQADFGHFQTCLSGPGNTPRAGCEDADLDGDGDVDHDDFGVLQGCMSGANVLADKHCDDL